MGSFFLVYFTPRWKLFLFPRLSRGLPLVLPKPKARSLLRLRALPLVFEQGLDLLAVDLDEEVAGQRAADNFGDGVK